MKSESLQILSSVPSPIVDTLREICHSGTEQSLSLSICPSNVLGLDPNSSQSQCEGIEVDLRTHHACSGIPDARLSFPPSLF